MTINRQLLATIVCVIGICSLVAAAGIAVADSDPVISDPDPADEDELDESVDELSVDISYDGFDDGETVNVTFFLEGEEITEKTVEEERRVTAPVDVDRGGEYEWSVEASDGHFNTAQEEYSFSLPDEVEIYDALETDQKLNASQQAHGSDIPPLEVEIFGEDGTERQTVTDGTIDLSGVVVEEPLSIRVREAEDSELDYLTRNSYIKTIYSQTDIYLVPGNETTTREVIFELDDLTGEFSRNSVLQVQRSITKDFDGDGEVETRFETMAGDSFDVSNKRAFNLIDDERYRLVLSNADGDVRTLGSYDVDASVVETLEVGEIAFDSEEISQGVDLTAKISDDGETINMRYQDADEKTTSLEIEITNQTGETIHTDLIGTIGTEDILSTYTDSVDIPEENKNDTFEITVSASRDGADDAELTETVGSVPDLGDQSGIPSRVLFLISWGAIVIMTGLTAIFDDGLAVMLAWSMATGLTMLGFINPPSVALAVAGAMALFYNVARSAPLR